MQSNDPFKVEPGQPLEAWARTLLGAARSRDNACGRTGTISEAEFRQIWARSGGRCELSALPFGSVKIGNGRAKRPFYPSLDRIDSNLAYTKDNVRLVVAIANFAMNAWGAEPLKQLAAAVARKFGEVAPLDAGAIGNDLSADEALDGESLDPELTSARFPPRSDVKAAIKLLLGTGPLPSSAIAQALAERFRLPAQATEAKLASGVTAWRNHVAWALVDLGVNARGSGEIEETAGVYRLASVT